MAIAWRCMRGAGSHTCLRLHALQWRTTRSDYGNRYYHAQPTFPNFQDERWGNVTGSCVCTLHCIVNWTALQIIHICNFITNSNTMFIHLLISQPVTTFPPHSNLAVYMLSLYFCFSQFCMQPKKTFLVEMLFYYTLHCAMLNAQHHQWQQFYYWCCQPLQSAMESFLHQIIQKCAVASQHAMPSTCTVKWCCPLYIVISYFQVWRHNIMRNQTYENNVQQC